MVARHYQRHCVNTSVSLARLCKDATENDVFQIFFLKKNLELLLGPDASGKNATFIDVFNFFKKKLKSKKKGKTPASDIFITRHWQ
jgi:hypothetical protein